ncbi:MAG: sulfite exporter TauE/SafE family protein [Ruminococcaceae bacterium]|nr:sulfite exporter TauE/SafE family protein [Oscillospiraceae bacterium]
MNALIDFIVSLLIGVLTGLGVGSGGLFLVYMTLVRHAEQIMAQGLNLAFFIYAALASIAVNLFKKRINIKILIFISVFGVGGVLLGSHILPFISPIIIRKIFGGILIALSLVTFFCKSKK